MLYKIRKKRKQNGRIVIFALKCQQVRKMGLSPGNFRLRHAPFGNCGAAPHGRLSPYKSKKKS